MNQGVGTNAPDSIQNNETLGREERSGTSARRAYRSLIANGKAKVRFSKFMPPKYTDVISVNRMDFQSRNSLAELGIINANSIGKDFWGWYTLTVVDTKEVGCYVKASPLLSNPNHADIVFPVVLEDQESKDKLTEIAWELAHRANFLPWGEWTDKLP